MLVKLKTRHLKFTDVLHEEKAKQNYNGLLDKTFVQEIRNITKTFIHHILRRPENMSLADHVQDILGLQFSRGGFGITDPAIHSLEAYTVNFAQSGQYSMIGIIPKHLNVKSIEYDTPFI